MPPINRYVCNHCGLSFPEGWGGYFYVEVDEEFLDKRIGDLQAKIEAYHKVLSAVSRYASELTERILRDLEGFRDRVQEAIREIQTIEGYEYRKGFLGDLVDRLLSIKSIDELHKELTRIEMQNREHIESIPLIRLLADLQRHVKSRINEAEALVKQLNDIKAQLKASGKKSLRIPCPHPNEKKYAIEILGVSPEHPLFKRRTGFNSYAICLDCLYQFEADFRDEKVNEWRLWYEYPTFKEAFRGKPQMKDERRCPRCGSANVKTVFELIGQPCPRCKVGVIVEIETGIMT
ncbi:MAG: hypothetical protein LM583_04805 [Desulfurococcaceae archaeon]|nr:hypothetical protein [Desulfurococcaceae archaeon]